MLWVSENYKDFKRLADELTAKEVRPNYDNCDIVIVFIKKKILMAEKFHLAEIFFTLI